MKIDIDKMTEAELVELNHRIVQRLKFLGSSGESVGKKAGI